MPDPACPGFCKNSAPGAVGFKHNKRFTWWQILWCRVRAGVFGCRVYRDGPASSRPISFHYSFISQSRNVDSAHLNFLEDQSSLQIHYIIACTALHGNKPILNRLVRQKTKSKHAPYAH
jgi:hypothetical protein